MFVDGAKEDNRINKRQRKKICKREICVIVYGCSIDRYCRKKLFNLPAHIFFDIDHKNMRYLPNEIQTELIKYGVEYKVCREKLDKNGEILFLFKSKEFKSIQAYSYNNPAVEA
jgi:hypothetical protein